MGGLAGFEFLGTGRTWTPYTACENITVESLQEFRLSRPAGDCKFHPWRRFWGRKCNGGGRLNLPTPHRFPVRSIRERPRGPRLYRSRYGSTLFLLSR